MKSQKLSCFISCHVHITWHIANSSQIVSEGIHWWKDVFMEHLLYYNRCSKNTLGSLVARMVKNLSAVQETWVWFLGWEDPLEKGMACLENPMDRGAWLATVHGVAKSQTWLSNFTFTFKHVEYGALSGLNTVNQDKCREHRKTGMICESQAPVTGQVFKEWSEHCK